MADEKAVETTTKVAVKTPVVTVASGAPGKPAATREEAHAIAAKIMGASGPKPDHVVHRDAVPDKPLLALRTFDYGGKSIDRGQIFRLQGLVNDKRMFDLRYFVPLEDGQVLYECPKCEMQFVSAGLRDSHVKTRHLAKRFVPPPAPIREPNEDIDAYQNRLDEWAKAAGAAADAADERRDRIENEVAPLDLTKTAASRGM